MYLALRSHFAGQVAGQAQRMASQTFEQQKSQLDASIRQTYEARFGEWKATELVKTIEENRADAVDASRAVLKGKIAEQIAPLLPGFLAKYSAADARFIGSPIDYLIFKGMSKGDAPAEPLEIVLLDVKTGKAGLNGVQKKIQEAAAAKRVSFDILRITGQAGTEKGPQQLELTALLIEDIPSSNSAESRSADPPREQRPDRSGRQSTPP